MSGEKKHWNLPTPFRRFSGKQDISPLQAKAGRSKRCVSSVYLSNDSPANGFVVIPEFDDPVRAETAQESSHISDPLSPNGVNYYLDDLGLICPHGPCVGGGPCNSSVIQDNDLTERLGSAYGHIRSMPLATLPEVSLSSDPQMLRKQLGVPQHSVLNYPIHSSLDLPNPHASPHDPTSPRPPPATSTDVSHVRSSNRHSLCANTNVYPPPLHRSSDPFQSVQRRCQAATSIPWEGSPPERRTKGEPGSARISPTSRPRPSAPNTSGPAKRFEKPVDSPSSLPASRRQPSRNVLRKPVAHTPTSNDVSRRQISLPQIRPPSPFRVNIPLHHTWHDRRTDFYSPHECHSRAGQSAEKMLRRTSESTDALASLAWIGTPSTASSSYTADRGRRSASPTVLPDCLNMVIAVEDDSISDDVLVNQLEMVRKICSPFEQGENTSPSTSLNHARVLSTGEKSRLSYSPQVAERLVKPFDAPLASPGVSKDTTSDMDDVTVWNSARKALLCVREIIRTEKRYQEALKMLLSAQTTTPPPPSMTPYVSALVRASEMLLKSFLDDPSAWGVSTAFVTSEDELEVTMVSWCTVAGGLFTDDNNLQSRGLTGRWRLRKSGMMLSCSPSMTEQTSRLSGKIGQRTTKPDSTYKQTAHGQPPSRKLSVRDLAILPIQRVMRYVLLYRDLLDCTPPTSPPRLLVERAVEAAMRIANHCNRAQRNPAFAAS